MTTKDSTTGAGADSGNDLDTPLAAYLRAAYDLPLPARFYDPKTLQPVIQLGKNATAASLISAYEKIEGRLSVDDIATAFILENAPTTPGVVSPKKVLLYIVDTLRQFGNEMFTRFGRTSLYATYSLAQLESDRASRESTLRALKEFERLLSDGITAANEKIAEYPIARLSKPEITQSNLVFTRVTWNADNVDFNAIKDRDLRDQPIIDRVRLTNEDAPDVFALIPVSSDPDGIPYLGFHTPTNNQYRVSSTTPSSYVIHPENDEYVYKMIIDSELHSELRGSTCFLSFLVRGIFAFIDLSHSTLILNRVTQNTEKDLSEHVMSLFPFLHIEGVTQRRITARILSPIGGPIAYHVLFFDTMINQADYIGFKEEEAPQLLKTLKIFYLSPVPRIVNPLTDEYAYIHEIRTVMMNRVAANSELVTFNKSDDPPYELTRGTAYVEFMVYDVSDSAMLDFTSAYLARLVGHYHEVAATEYAPFITSKFRLPLTISASDVSSDAVYARASSEVRSIDVMSHTYPEVFGHNYTRQCPHYPQVKARLDDSDEEYSPDDEVKEEQGSRNKWLRYPPDGAVEFYFRCGVEGDPEYAHPGVVVSKLKNRARYPLIPCCFLRDQFTPGKHTEVAYRLGSAEASGISVTDITMSGWGSLVYPPTYNKRLLMTSERTLYRGRLGRLPESLMTIMTTQILEDGNDALSSPAEERRHYVRLGLSEPTVLHAAYLAVDPEYQKLSTGSSEERLNYIKQHIKLPHPACLYQELPPDQAIHERLMETIGTPNAWSSVTHYRIIEEALGINLYVIMRITPRENVPEPNRFFFELPTTRTGAPHMRRHRLDRPSVILYRVRRFEGDLVVDSGFELLVHGGTPVHEFSGVWGTAITSRIAELYARSCQVLSFGISPIDSDSYKACVGLYTADYAGLLQHPPASQVIDERGLCRALNYPREGISIVFPGTQPYNLPFSSQIFFADAADTKAKLLEIFGAEPCLASWLRDGVFYKVGSDASRYIFIPTLLQFDAAATVPFTPLTGLSTTSVGYSTQWRTAYTYLRVILFLISFLYAFAEPRNPRSFMEQYVTIDTTRHAAHVSDIYDFSGLKRIIVLRELTMSEALASIKRLAPTLLDEAGEKMVVTSQKIFEGLAYFIRIVHDQTVTIPNSLLRKRRWDLAKVVSHLRESGEPASRLLSARGGKSDNDDGIKVLHFGSPRAVKTWFKGIRSGATSGGMVLSSDVQSVKDTVRAKSGVILWRHPKTGRVWLIPGATYYLADAVVVCYLWISQHRIVELASHLAITAAVERVAVASGGGVGGGQRRPSRITAMFRERSGGKSNRRSTRSKSGRLVLDDDEESEINSVRGMLQRPDMLKILKYGITRDNNIELLADDDETQQSKPSALVIEVLRTGPDRYTPMLSP